jgi:hypothetical protein
MSVNSTPPVIQHNGNGVTKSFNYPFKILEAEDLVANAGAADLVLHVDYEITGVGADVGGQVVFTVAPIVGVKNVTLSRQMKFNRTTDYQYQGALPSPVVNADFDRTILMLQQVAQIGVRSIKLPFAETTDQTLSETAAQRANKALVFDSLGNATVSDDDYLDQVADVAAIAAEALASQNAASGSAAAALASQVAAAVSEGVALSAASALNVANAQLATGIITFNNFDLGFVHDTPPATVIDLGTVH